MIKPIAGIVVLAGLIVAIGACCGYLDYWIDKVF